MSVKKEDNVKEEKQQLSRRDFIKAAGVTAGVAGIAAAGSATPALAAKKDNGSAIMNFAVKEVDHSTYMDYPYEFDDSVFKRMSNMETGFNSQALMDAEFGGEPWVPHYMNAREGLAIKGDPGYSPLDLALADAALTTDTICSKTLMSWEPLAVNTTIPEQAGIKYDNPDDNNRYVKKAANVFGAGDCGISAVNEKWFYSEQFYVEGSGIYQTEGSALPIVFTDKYDKPTINKEGMFIPKKMNRVITLVLPIEGELAKYSPSRLAEAPDNLAYSQKIEIASKVAEFVRGLGYNAIPAGNEIALNIPCAIDAGLGELGRNGLLIHPKYGSLCKLTKVITDMPITVDKPISFGVGEFCRTCMKCADSCPSGSISKDKDPSYEVKCPSNNPGVKKWYLNAWQCLTYWCKQNGSCLNCMTVCPYSKPQTWIHDVVKGISSRTAIFNSTFRFMDDALGYGKTIDENNPDDFWEQEGIGVEWLKL